MREVKYYISFDDKRFDDKKECSDYEEKIGNYMMEIIRSFAFYDVDMKQFNHYFESLEGMLCSFDWAWENCVYIRKIANCSQEALDFIQDYFGYPLPNEIGLNRYAWREQKWVKVGEQPTLIFC